MKNQKRIFTVLFCIVMFQLIFLNGVKADAAMNITEPLDFTTKLTDEVTEGYRWEAATHTLHLTGICINVSSVSGYCDAVKLPSDATIICEEGTYNCIIGSSRYAVVSNDMADTNATLTVKGKGALDFLYCASAFSTYNNLTIDGCCINGVGIADFIYTMQGKMERDHWVKIKNSTINLYNTTGGIYTKGQYATDPKKIEMPFYETNVLIDHSNLDFQIGVNYFNTEDRYYGISVMNGRLMIKQSKVNIDSIEPAIVVWRQYNQNDQTSQLVQVDESGSDYFVADGQEFQAKEKNILGCKFRMETVVKSGDTFDFDFKRNGREPDQTLTLAYGHEITGASDRLTINEYSDELLHFECGIGNSISDMTYKVLHAQGALPVPTSDGAVFLGWSTDGTKEKICTYESVVKNLSEMTLHAVWEQTIVPSEKPKEPVVTDVPQVKPTATVQTTQEPSKPTEAKSEWGKVTGLKQKEIKPNQITVTYNLMKEATGYYIYVYDPQTKKYVKQTEMKSDCSKITIKKLKRSKGKKAALKPGTSYKIKLKAVRMINGKIEMSPESQFTAYTCPAKTTIKVSRAKQGKQLKLAWKKNATASGYVLRFRLKGAKKDTKQITLTSKKKSYIYAIKKNKKYDIYFRAYKKFGKKRVYSQTSHVRI